MIKDIKYQGHSAVPSDYECMDGELAGCYNLVPEDGALHPIMPPEVKFTLPDGYTLCFIHNPSVDVNNYILYYDGDLFWVTDDDPVPSSQREIGSVTSLIQINAVGNTLVVLTEQGIFYYLWKNGSYVNLGNKIPEMFMNFSLKAENAVTSEEIKIHISGDPQDQDAAKGCTLNGVTFCNRYWLDRYFMLPYLAWEATPQTWIDGAEFHTEEEKIVYNDAIKAKANPIIANSVTNKGKFCMPFFVRYAMRLYDDTLVMHSAPVLMLPDQILTTVLDNGDHDINDRYSIQLSLNPCALQYQLMEFDSATFENWKDIVKSLDIFVSAPIWDYDQAGFCNKMLSDGYIRKSISKQLSAYTPIPSSGEGIADWHDNGKPSIPQHSRETLVKNIEECANFYLLHSFSIDELSGMTFTDNFTPRTDIVVPDDYLGALLAREVMTDDYQSHDDIIAKQSYNFNGRLNIASLTRQLYNGYNPWSAVCMNTGGSSDKYVSAYVEIYDEERTMVVKHDAQLEIGAHSDLNLLFTPQGITWYFYPDTKAKRAVIKIGSDVYELPLKPHQHLNGAYFFNSLTGPSTTTTEPTTTTDNYISIPNKIYTSEINNPFYFPLLGINTVGTGEIMGICAAVKALSQGQFGQYPLYCFTTEGVWALETSSTGSYIARQPVTRDVCTNPDSITQLDDSVLFATDKGIMLLSGSQTQCITDAISSEFPFNIAELPDSFANFLGDDGYDVNAMSMQPFSSFLSGCRMIYDYTHQRIIVYNTSHDYAYVYSLKDHKWGMMVTNIDYGINSYPEALAVTDADTGGTRSVVNLSDEVLYNTVDNEQVPVHVKGLIVTRPLKLDQPDALKTIDTIIQRGKFNFLDSQRTVKPIRSILFGSRDLYNWFLVSSSTDHNLRGFSGTPYKYFRIVALVDFLPDESVYGATIQYNPRYLNRPR